MIESLAYYFPVLIQRPVYGVIVHSVVVTYVQSGPHTSESASPECATRNTTVIDDGS